MNKGNINISVSGGSASFGNVSQGDHNTLSGSVQQALQDFHQNLSELRQAHLATDEQVQRLKQDIDALLNQPQQPGMLEKAKSLYDTYSWAVDPLRKLFSVMFP